MKRPSISSGSLVLAAAVIFIILAGGGGLTLLKRLGGDQLQSLSFLQDSGLFLLCILLAAFLLLVTLKLAAAIKPDGLTREQKIDLDQWVTHTVPPGVRTVMELVNEPVFPSLAQMEESIRSSDAWRTTNAIYSCGNVLKRLSPA